MCGFITWNVFNWIASCWGYVRRLYLEKGFKRKKKCAGNIIRISTLICLVIQLNSNRFFKVIKIKYLKSKLRSLLIIAIFFWILGNERLKQTRLHTCDWDLKKSKGFQSVKWKVKSEKWNHAMFLLALLARFLSWRDVRLLCSYRFFC